MRLLHDHNLTQDEELGVDLTPMLDVVFIMLIFFIVTATFIKESGIEVDRPNAVTSVQQERANILVAIDAQNNVWMDQRQVDIRAVRPNIQRLHAENPQGTVIIQADRNSRTEMLVRVMDAARAAGVESIALAAEVQE